MRRFRRHTPPRALGSPLRTAGELRAQAEGIAKGRRKAAREREVRKRLLRECQEQAARDRYLTDLAKREHDAWERVDALIATKRPGDYDGAVSLLVDLRDVNEQKGRAAEFAQRIGALREAHAKKPSLLARFSKTGL